MMNCLPLHGVRALKQALGLLAIVAALQDLPSISAREWEDEIFYVVIMDKFFNGDESNDIMLKRYGKDKNYKQGYRGGDLKWVLQKLD